MSIFQRYTALECRCGPQKSRREQRRTSGFSSFISLVSKVQWLFVLDPNYIIIPLTVQCKSQLAGKTEKLTWTTLIRSNKRTAVKDIRLSKLKKILGIIIACHSLDNCCRNSQTTKQSKSSLGTVAMCIGKKKCLRL